MYSGSKVSTLCKWNRTLLSPREATALNQTDGTKESKKKKERKWFTTVLVENT
jgi:hypothetical protein